MRSSRDGTFAANHRLAGLWAVLLQVTVLTINVPGAVAGDGPPLDCRPEARQQEAARPSGSTTPGDGRAPISGPREMLTLLGMDASRLDGIKDSTPLEGNDRETLWRLLITLRRFALLDVDRWKQREPDWDRLGREPAAHRGEILEFSGRVKSVTLEHPPGPKAEQFDLPEYYRCEFAIGQANAPATIYTLKVPKAWRLDEPLDERATVQGFFFKLAGDSPELVRPVFVAARVAWHPATLLGDLGMDLGLFDDVRAIGPLTQPAGVERTFSDRECFYQLLAAAGRTGASELTDLTGNFIYQAIPLLQKPEAHFGELVAFDGLARRATLVRVEDPDIVARFGIDHYYELEVTVELEKWYRGRDGDFHSFPMVFCMRRLPKGMPLGERINETVRIPAFFFKVWTYRSERSAAKGPTVRQLAPLLVGREPVWVVAEPVDQSFSSTVFIGVFVLLTIGAWIIVWRLNRGDEKFRRRIIVRKYAIEGERSLNELGLEDQGPPDFSYLNDGGKG